MSAEEEADYDASARRRRRHDDDEGDEWESSFSRQISGLFKVKYLFKLVAAEVAVYLVLYYAINLAYRFLMNQEQKERFEKVVKYFDRELGSFGRDLTFLLGFYVSLVAKRWWDQYRLLPWPDDLAMSTSGLVVTADRESRHLRETVVRYALLSYALCIRRFSANLQRHLPRTEDLIRAGLLRSEEAGRLHLDDLKGKTGRRNELLASNWWLPIAWAMNMVKFGRVRKDIPGDSKELLRALLRFRHGLESVESHVHVAIPLVYKLVVTTAVYAYFALTLVGSQNVGRGEDVDLYFPLFVVFKLVLIIGWLKVARSIEAPFGEDDADFQMNSLLKRHIRTVGVILADFDDIPGQPPSGGQVGGPQLVTGEEAKEEKKGQFHFHAFERREDEDDDDRKAESLAASAASAQSSTSVIEDFVGRIAAKAVDDRNRVGPLDGGVGVGRRNL